MKPDDLEQKLAQAREREARSGRIKEGVGAAVVTIGGGFFLIAIIIVSAYFDEVKCTAFEWIGWNGHPDSCP